MMDEAGVDEHHARPTHQSINRLRQKADEARLVAEPYLAFCTAMLLFPTTDVRNGTIRCCRNHQRGQAAQFRRELLFDPTDRGLKNLDGNRTVFRNIVRPGKPCSRSHSNVRSRRYQGIGILASPGNVITRNDEYSCGSRKCDVLNTEHLEIPYEIGAEARTRTIDCA